MVAEMERAKASTEAGRLSHFFDWIVHSNGFDEQRHSGRAVPAL